MDSFYRAIVDINLRDFGFGPFQRCRIDRVTVVLARDRYLTGAKVFHWVIATSVTEFQLEGLATYGMAENLIAEANPKHRLFAQQPLHRLDDVAQALRVSRSR